MQPFLRLLLASADLQLDDWVQHSVLTLGSQPAEPRSRCASGPRGVRKGHGGPQVAHGSASCWGPAGPHKAEPKVPEHQKSSLG